MTAFCVWWAISQNLLGIYNKQKSLHGSDASQYATNNTNKPNMKEYKCVVVKIWPV